MSGEARAWETSSKPVRMLELHPPTSDRKGRLLLVACCRMCWEQLVDERSRDAVEIAERMADGVADTREVEQAHNVASDASIAVDVRWQELREDLRAAEADWRGGAIGFRLRQLEDECDRQRKMYYAAVTARAALFRQFSDADYRNGIRLLEPEFAVALLRDIFGNPFRPIAFSPSWRTDTALTLARQMYGSRDFGAMPILADALQDAGCEDPAILDHCRNPQQVHVRGCWVTDLVLGKQ